MDAKGISLKTNSDSDLIYAQEDISIVVTISVPSYLKVRGM